MRFRYLTTIQSELQNNQSTLQREPIRPTVFSHRMNRLFLKILTFSNRVQCPKQTTQCLLENLRSRHDNGHVDTTEESDDGG